MTTSLLSDENREAFVSDHRAEYEKIRRTFSTKKHAHVPFHEAQRHRAPISWRAEDIARPERTGVRVVDRFPLATLREFIDWTPFFHTWELRGVFPKIFEHPKYGEQAKKVYEEANELLERIVREDLFTARGVYGLFPASSIGDDVEVYDDARSHVQGKFHFLRQQGEKEGTANLSLADFVAPRESGLGDHIGAFAVTTGFGLPELNAAFRKDNDDYNAIMAEALADRLAEAFAECLHKRVREEWGYGRSEQLSPADLIAEKYRGIRPAPGYPACPDHTEKATIWRLLDVEKNTGMKLTESFAMWPGSSVSGLYFAHPEAKYFTVGKIERDQVTEYARRKGMSVAEVERWLAPNLGYDLEVVN